MMTRREIEAALPEELQLPERCAIRLIELDPAVGGLIALNGFFNLAQALDQRREQYTRWTASLAMAILTIVLGLLIVFNPFSTMEMLVVAIGIIIIYNGVSNLLIELGYRRMNR